MGIPSAMSKSDPDPNPSSDSVNLISPAGTVYQAMTNDLLADEFTAVRRWRAVAAFS